MTSFFPRFQLQLPLCSGLYFLYFLVIFPPLYFHLLLQFLPTCLSQKALKGSTNTKSQDIYTALQKRVGARPLLSLGYFSLLPSVVCVCMLGWLAGQMNLKNKSLLKTSYPDSPCVPSNYVKNFTMLQSFLFAKKEPFSAFSHFQPCFPGANFSQT